MEMRILMTKWTHIIRGAAMMMMMMVRKRRKRRRMRMVMTIWVNLKLWLRKKGEAQENGWEQENEEDE